MEVSFGILVPLLIYSILGTMMVILKEKFNIYAIILILRRCIILVLVNILCFIECISYLKNFKANF